MKKGIELRKTVKNERFLVHTKVKTIKVRYAKNKYDCAIDQELTIDVKKTLRSK